MTLQNGSLISLRSTLVSFLSWQVKKFGKNPKLHNELRITVKQNPLFSPSSFREVCPYVRPGSKPTSDYAESQSHAEKICHLIWDNWEESDKLGKYEETQGNRGNITTANFEHLQMTGL